MRERLENGLLAAYHLPSAALNETAAGLADVSPRSRINPAISLRDAPVGQEFRPRLLREPPAEHAPAGWRGREARGTTIMLTMMRKENSIADKCTCASPQASFCILCLHTDKMFHILHYFPDMTG